MKYFVRRGKQEFGPYSIEDIRRYLGTGNIAPTDMAREENCSAWVPLYTVAAAPAEPAIQPTAGYAGITTANAPDLHWAIVLVLSSILSFLFTFPWAIVQAQWARRVDASCKAMQLYWIGMPLFLLGALVTIFSPGVKQQEGTLVLLFPLMIFAASILFIMPRFEVKSAIEQAYSDLGAPYKLSGVMTFFFTEIYLQYHLSAISKIQHAVRMVSPVATT